MLDIEKNDYIKIILFISMSDNNITPFAAHWNNVIHPMRNYVIPDYCKSYNNYLKENGYQMGNSIAIPQMFEAPNFLHGNYMFDEIVDIRDEDRDHKIDIIRNMMKVVLE